MNKHPFMPFGSYKTRQAARNARELFPFPTKVERSTTNWSLRRVS